VFVPEEFTSLQSNAKRVRANPAIFPERIYVDPAAEERR
jgi:hypothetical protein